LEKEMKKIVPVLCLVAALISAISSNAAAQAEFDIKIYPSKLELAGAPATTQDFVINIENQGTQDQTLRVYFNDYLIRPDNKFVFKEPGHYSYSCAKWLSTDSPTVVAPAGETVQKGFELAVPDDAEPGGHYGVIFFEQVPPGTEPVVAQGRIGVVTLVTVPGEIVRKGKIESVSVTSSWFWPSRRVLAGPEKVTRARVVFRNEGNVHLTVRGKVTYAPTFGWGTGTVKLGEITVLPKTTRYLEAEIPNPPILGSYKVSAEVSYGPSLDVFDTTVTKEGEFHQYPFFWLVIILILVLLVAAIVILVRWLRRRRKRGKEGAPAEELEGEGDRGSEEDSGGGLEPKEEESDKGNAEEEAETADPESGNEMEPESDDRTPEGAESGGPGTDGFQLRNSKRLFDPED
jgi:hypothetical protein